MESTKLKQKTEVNNGPWFIAVERFGRKNGEAWSKYIEDTGLSQIEELVSLDTMLCPPVFSEIRDDYWPHIVNEDYYGHFFTDLKFLRDQLAEADSKEARLLCVFRNPHELPKLSPELRSFRFLGFDLVEAASGVSALSNCGGWPELKNEELSKWGLITDLNRVLELQKELPRAHPEEPHANCNVWAIFAETN
ncbi:MAG: hypothetical protein IPH06_02880 [Alphaproteobacteria bacterium]|nr:hypothetical protein [Alphaproteobacteria bacterium]QQS56987.1 MAG: hypothetical protein IPN28_12135 [Alphaproteobacteria bacterium]